MYPVELEYLWSISIAPLISMFLRPILRAVAIKVSSEYLIVVELATVLTVELPMLRVALLAREIPVNP